MRRLWNFRRKNGGYLARSLSRVNRRHLAKRGRRPHDPTCSYYRRACLLFGVGLLKALEQTRQKLAIIRPGRRHQVVGERGGGVSARLREDIETFCFPLRQALYRTPIFQVRGGDGEDLVDMCLTSADMFRSGCGKRRFRNLRETLVSRLCSKPATPEQALSRVKVMQVFK